jgi:hypothetical protein
MASERPIGVVIIALLELLLGVIIVLGAMGLFLLAGLSTSEEVRRQISSDLPQWVIDNAVLVFGSLGAISLLIGMVALLVGYGFWTAKSWAWTVGVIFAVITIFSAFIDPLVYGFENSNWLPGLLLSLLFSWAILFYLNRPNVKTYFGKEIVPDRG